jgi:chemotaxis signal transduction protein
MMHVSEKDMSANSELIAFRLGGQEFCVDIMSVRDIRGWTQTTPLPHSPEYVKGVINLRGSVLPVIDLAARLGFKATEPTARHVIICPLNLLSMLFLERRTRPWDAHRQRRSRRSATQTRSWRRAG